MSESRDKKLNMTAGRPGKMLLLFGRYAACTVRGQRIWFLGAGWLFCRYEDRIDLYRAHDCNGKCDFHLYGTAYLSFTAWFFVFIGLKALTDGVLRGSGDVLVFTIANLCNLAVRVFVAFRFAPVWGVQAVWFAVPMGWATNYIISFLRYLTGKWSKKRLI